MKEHAKPIATLQLNDSASVIITEHSVIAVYIKLLRDNLPDLQDFSHFQLSKTIHTSLHRI